MDLVFSSWHDIPFNENHRKQLHQILLRRSEKDARHRGQYKSPTNSVAAFHHPSSRLKKNREVQRGQPSTPSTMRLRFLSPLFLGRRASGLEDIGRGLAVTIQVSHPITL